MHFKLNHSQNCVDMGPDDTSVLVNCLFSIVTVSQEIPVLFELLDPLPEDQLVFNIPVDLIQGWSTIEMRPSEEGSSLLTG